VIIVITIPPRELPRERLTPRKLPLRFQSRLAGFILPVQSLAQHAHRTEFHCSRQLSAAGRAGTPIRISPIPPASKTARSCSKLAIRSRQIIGDDQLSRIADGLLRSSVPMADLGAGRLRSRRRLLSLSTPIRKAGCTPSCLHAPMSEDPLANSGRHRRPCGNKVLPPPMSRRCDRFRDKER
jgi:hypothetical protein